jgi:hypothetical protein
MPRYDNYVNPMDPEEACLKTNGAMSSDPLVGHKHKRGDEGQGAQVDPADIDVVVNSALAGGSSTGNLLQMLCWVTKQIKALTGLTNWYDAFDRGAGFLYLQEAGAVSSVGFTITRNQTHIDNNIWLTIGPTGSGADIIWSLLDALPVGTKAVKLHIEGTSRHLGGSPYWQYIQAFFRKNGSTYNFPRWVVMVSTGATNQISSSVGLVDVLLDNQKKFQFKWQKNVSSPGECDLLIDLAGYWK